MLTPVERAKIQNKILLNAYADSNTPVLATYPRRIQILPTLRCNYRCRMCFQPDEDHKQGGEIDFALLRKLEHVYPFMEEVYFTGGEPLLYSRLEEATRLFAAHGVRVTMSSNGSLLKGELLPLALDHFHMIKVSIDAASPKTYAGIRINGNFNNVIANLARVSAMKGQRRSLTPHLQFGFVAMRSNIEELPKLVALAADIGISSIHVGHVASGEVQGDMGDESLSRHKELSDEQFLRAQEMAQALGVEIRLPRLFGAAGGTQDAKPSTTKVYDTGICKEPWKFMLLNPDGRISICCHKGIIAGNLAESDFDEIWNNAFYQRIRRTLNTANEPPECSGCPYYKRTLMAERAREPQAQAVV
ncbi:radical SAM protein [Paucidesulfovibrio longus]|uniref:radical SAM protein n=1 Tax=Paucidesulfovibrio longus TaxID=889 RepID=UPI0003B4DED2|nr:radical SAM protein [Paucidesulfovibrio longus]